MSLRPYYEEPGITIYHGDCREVLPILPAVDLILTDPPYGVGLTYGHYQDHPQDYWTWFLPILQQLRQYCPHLIMTHRQAALRRITDWDHLCIWHKPMSFGYAIRGWIAKWEPIFVFGLSPSFQANATRKPAHWDVFTTMTEPNHYGHPCPKPVALMKELLMTFTNTVICDPFCGSGSSLRAAKDLGISAIGIDIEERYCEIAVNRLRQGVLPLTTPED